MVRYCAEVARETLMPEGEVTEHILGGPERVDLECLGVDGPDARDECIDLLSKLKERVTSGLHWRRAAGSGLTLILFR